MISSADHTRLKNRENRLWEMAGFSIPGGVSVERLTVAIVLGLVAAAPTAVVLWMAMGALWAFASIFAFLGAGVTGYLLAGRRSTGGLSVLQKLMITLHFWFRQPKRIAGFGRDVEPGRAHWQVSPWTPNDPDWREEYRIRLAHSILNEQPEVDVVATNEKLEMVADLLDPARSHRSSNPS